MNHPQTAYPSILVGGTNGKGSICAMTTAMLTAAGYTVGLYTSPHLIDVRERFRCNGQMITKRELAACVRMVREAAREPLTYFEFLTVLAFQYFFIKKVDVAVLEVGMGGRLDATNVVDPIVSVISNISLEHCAYLGHRLAQIAGEKAGIIKEKGICLTGSTQKVVRDVLEQTCGERHAEFYRMGHDIRIQSDPGRKTFSYCGLEKRYRQLSCSLAGRHQTKNAALAIGITEILPRAGLAVDECAVRAGLENVHWEGRLEVLRKTPCVVLDGAHNPAGISALCAALKESFSYRRLLVICGVLRDKDYQGMLKQIAALADVLILTRPVVDRALTVRDLAAAAQGYHHDVLIQEDPLQALNDALAMADPEDLICVTGSLYLVGQIKAAFERERKH